MQKIVFFLIISLVVCFCFAVRSCRENKEEKERLASNQQTLLSGIDFYKTKDSLSAASVERLILSNREFKQYCSGLEKTVESLNLKVKRLQSVSRTVAETKYRIETVIRDSIIPGRIDTLRCIDYRDAYLTLVGCDFGGKFIGDVISRDTLDQVVHRVPRRLWFVKFGCKAIRQEVVTRNPYTKIVYTEYIELKR